MRGDRGTEVALEYDRAGVRKEVKFSENRIRINNVPYSGMIDDEIGYIAFNGIYPGCRARSAQGLKGIERTT
ncbi:hypothetical protein D5R40_33715 [Okeania hirsuta]|uniref:Uncharacterized protein n=1 Tax=Okeania hirsuta TaxID=1458930 RepID=A0A3N6NP40_9CYAN|nr:hypothetical protein D5R40_33715 [Okeania hirsuta]